MHLEREEARSSNQHCFRNYNPGAIAHAGQPPLLLGSLTRKGFWGDGAAGTWSSVSRREPGQEKGLVRSRKPHPQIVSLGAEGGAGGNAGVRKAPVPVHS